MSEKLMLGILSEDGSFAHTIGYICEINFNVFIFSNEDELFAWLEQSGQEVDCLIVDGKNQTNYNPIDIIATIADPFDGWPHIRALLIGQEPTTPETRTSVWDISINADYIGYPFTIQQLIAVISGQLTRVSD